MKYLKCDLAQVLLNLLRSNALVDVEFSVLRHSKITCICMARQVFIFLVLSFCCVFVRLVGICNGKLITPKRVPSCFE